MLGENAGEGGAGFLGAVFVVGGDEDDVFSFAGTFTAFVGDLSEGRNDGDEEKEDVFHGDCYVGNNDFLAIGVK